MEENPAISKKPKFDGSSHYALEDSREFQRLEEQARSVGYECEAEIKDLDLKEGTLVLDAGCGSGIVSRTLAQQNPAIDIIGCDVSEERIKQASDLAKAIPNISFLCSDLGHLSFPDNHFDVVICRYVLHHLSSDKREEVIRELYRCLKPHGRLIAIDPDNMLYTLHPQPILVAMVFKLIEASAPIDLCVGRKLPYLLYRAGFFSLNWRVEVICGNSGQIPQEANLMEQRFEQLMSFFSNLIGDQKIALEFKDQFLGALKRPYSLYYCNKVIVTAVKA